MAYSANRHFNLYLGALILVAVVCWWPHHTRANSEVGPIVFDEVMWAGSSISTADEWLVLYNTAYTPITLDSWKIQKLEDNKPTDMVTLSGLIPAEGYYLISNNRADHLFGGGESILNIIPDLVDSDLSLSNTNLQLTLCNGDCGVDEISDIAGNGREPPAGNNLSPKSSMKRVDYSMRGDQPSVWTSNANQLNLDSSAIELATPHNSNRFDIKLTTLATHYRVGEEMILHIEVIGNNSWPVSVGLDNQSVGDFYNFEFDIPVSLATTGMHNFSITVTNSAGMQAQQTVGITTYNLGRLGFSEISPQVMNDSADPWSREWIELINDDSQAINTIGWSVCDQAGHCQVLEDAEIPPGGVMGIVVDKPLSLNDDDELLTLTDPENNIIASVNWRKSYHFCSLITWDNESVWTSDVTFGSSNRYVECSGTKTTVTPTTMTANPQSPPAAANTPDSLVSYIKRSVIRTGYDPAWLDNIGQLTTVKTGDDWFKLTRLTTEQRPKSYQWSWWWLAVLSLVVIRRGYQTSLIVLRL